MIIQIMPIPYPVYSAPLTEQEEATLAGFFICLIALQLLVLITRSIIYWIRGSEEDDYLGFIIGSDFIPLVMFNVMMVLFELLIFFFYLGGLIAPYL
jgi:hypothetical protein